MKKIKLLGLLVAATLVVGCTRIEIPIEDVEKTPIVQVQTEQEKIEQEKTEKTKDDVAEVDPVTPSTTQGVQAKLHFINTGQSDCILIESDGEYMLIDGGDKDDDQTIKRYLQKEGVTALKYVVATHFHADHLGGLDTIVRDFGVESVYVPNGDATTAVYREFIEACMNRGLQPSVPLPDVTFNLGNSTFRFLNVKGGYSNTNNNSLIVELTSGETKALFTGDAEKEVEEAILNELTTIDLLKVGHHGSSSSSTEAFLDKLQPKVAIIQTALGNKYGHPHKETMAALKAREISVHRNDECGDIVYTINDNGLTTDCPVEGSYINGNSKNKEDVTPAQTKPEATLETKPEAKPETKPEVEKPVVSNGKVVYWTPNGKSYHTTKVCSALSKSKTILEGTQQESGKDDPCDRCH